jgi:hypothetical protein
MGECRPDPALFVVEKDGEMKMEMDGMGILKTVVRELPSRDLIPPRALRQSVMTCIIGCKRVLMHRSVEGQRCGGSRMIRYFPKERTPLTSTPGIDPLYTTGGVQGANWTGLNCRAYAMCQGILDPNETDFVALNQFLERTCLAQEIAREAGASCRVQHSDAHLRSGLLAGGWPRRPATSR